MLEMWLPSEKKSATGLVIFLLFKKGTNLSGYPKQKIFVFKVCANIVVTTTRKLQMVITSVQVVPLFQNLQVR